MTQITMIRHGQANSHADNAEDYDRLSPLGEQQARWLGAHMAHTGARFDHVICGDMRRHHGTARGMGQNTFDIDARFDELDYFALAKSAERHHGVPFNSEDNTFAENAPKIMAHWEADSLPDVPERYASFQTRILAGIEDACARGGHHLIVTSGGVISLVLRYAMGLDVANFSKAMLPIRNSSIHSFEHLQGTFFLTGYNAIPHLDAPDRAHARTFY
ncbi:MAG: histidine phosphatase family protein [Marinovum sp.]|nr:histidine phosphatase family protein [Marinovum sp.]